MIAVVFSATWHAAWWEWHVLMVAAFATIAIGARAEYRRARSLPGAFGGLYLDSTLDRIDRRRAAALSSLVAALRAGEPLSPVLSRARDDWASPEEVALLEGAAHQLHQTDALFRTYVSPQLASGLEAHPELAVLAGAEGQAGPGRGLRAGVGGRLSCGATASRAGGGGRPGPAKSAEFTRTRLFIGRSAKR